MTAAVGAVVPLLVVVGLLVGDPGPTTGQERRNTAEGRALLDQLTSGGPRVDHRGEILCITWYGDATHVEMVQVVGSSAGLLLHTAAQGLVRLPAQQARRPGVQPAVLRTAHGPPFDKYDVRVTGEQRLLDRPTTQLEVRRRAGDLLRERLWIDDRTGLLLRRESYDGDHRLQLSAYQRLDLEPASRRERQLRVVHGPASPGGWERWGASGSDTLLPAGVEVPWDPPLELPGGYRSSGAFVSEGDGIAAVQHVYDDGLYSVSVFTQPGAPDWDALPPGAEPVEGTGGRAYEWPGAVPQRLVWEASGTTFTLVTDAPPGEFRTIADALPQPSAPGVLDRLEDGLARLWGLMAS